MTHSVKVVNESNTVDNDIVIHCGGRPTRTLKPGEQAYVGVEHGRIAPIALEPVEPSDGSWSTYKDERGNRIDPATCVLFLRNRDVTAISQKFWSEYRKASPDLPEYLCDMPESVKECWRGLAQYILDHTYVAP